MTDYLKKADEWDALGKPDVFGLPARRIIFEAQAREVAAMYRRLAEAEAQRDMAMEAIVAVVSATRAYLPPDGIDAQECVNRVIGATDNLTINPLIANFEGTERD